MKNYQQFSWGGGVGGGGGGVENAKITKSIFLNRFSFENRVEGVKVYILLKFSSIPTEKLIFGECCCQDNRNICHQK